MIPESELANGEQDIPNFAPALWSALFNEAVMPQAFATFCANFAHWEASSARNNPFDTEESFTGGTNYNSAGVKDYETLAEGVAATVATIDDGNFPFLRTLLVGIGTDAVNAQWLRNLEHDINIWQRGDAAKFGSWTNDMLTNPDKYLESFSVSAASTTPTTEPIPNEPTPESLQQYDDALNASLWNVANALALFAEQISEAANSLANATVKYRTKPNN